MNFKRPLSALLLVTLLMGMLGAAAAPARAQNVSIEKAILTAGSPAEAQALDGGGKLLVDYGAFSLWSLPADTLHHLDSLSGISYSPEFDRIYLRGDKYTGFGTSAPEIQSALRQVRTAEPQFWMVQFIGPVKDEWLTKLHRMGLETVTYLPNNAYVVWGDGDSLKSLDQAVAGGTPLQWAGAYHPEYRLSPELNTLASSGAAEWTTVTVQLYRTAHVNDSVEKLKQIGGKLLSNPENIAKFTNISLELPADRLIEVANWPDVFNLESWHTREMADEVQNLIIAGEITTNASGKVVPTTTRYLDWLESKGFPTTPESYPIVDIVDDGIDQGNANAILHPDFYELGNSGSADRVSSITNCTADATGDSIGGHGNLNAGIVGSYNNGESSPAVDALGYHIGLGVSPYGRISGTKIFDNTGAYDTSACGYTDETVVASSYQAGAAITNNSWGADVTGAYTTESQAYDWLTRDASTDLGNQPMLHIFAAGNVGPGVTTIGSPATAKNVLTVGATENVRDEGVIDGSGISAGDNADDMAVFSSRGPTADGRVKPDIVAPGTHVQGPASQAPGFTGSGVSGMFDDIYYPSGQTLYTWSSGTSHSTPAVAGAASLLYEYYGRVLAPGEHPSPAMLKALLLNTPRYLDGYDTGGSLPSSNQGWGGVDLGMLFDSVSYQLYDQRAVDLLRGTGTTRLYAGAIQDVTRPFRVSLVWSDAPGSTTGNAYVNNLNLEVTVNGNTYLGNVFSGEFSTPGGTADVRNNVENVFLPAGASGNFTIRVTGANIAGDGLPGNDDSTDQDYALAIYNGAEVDYTVLNADGYSLTQVTGNGDGVVDQNETFDLSIPLINSSPTAATQVQGTLSLTGGSASISQPISAYPDIAPAETRQNSILYRFTVGDDQTCGNDLTFHLDVSYSETQSLDYHFAIRAGAATAGTPTQYIATDVPKTIPDQNTAGIASLLSIADTGITYDVDVHLDEVSHTYDGDLGFSLTSPAGTAVTLVSRRGSSGDGYLETVLDDSASAAISSGSAPFTGRFKPEESLSAFNGQSPEGTWTLNAADHAAQDTGELVNWSLVITPVAYQCTPYRINTAPVLAPIGNRGGVEGTVLSFSVTATDSDEPAGSLRFSLDEGAPQGAMIDAVTGLFTWTPGEVQGPGIYLITLRVADDGSPALEDDETIVISVAEANAAPILAPIGNRSVLAGATLSFSAGAVDSDLPANGLTFSLDPGAPAGAIVHPTSGAFSWTPTPDQAPGAYLIKLRVSDDGAPSLDDSETFEVTVGKSPSVLLYLPLIASIR